MMQAHLAIALRIGQRYFCRWRRDGKVFTAWSLAGARLYGPWADDFLAIDEDRLRRKGYKAERVTIAAPEPAETEAAF